MGENCIITPAFPPTLPQIPQKIGGIYPVGILSPSHVEGEHTLMRLCNPVPHAFISPPVFDINVLVSKCSTAHSNSLLNYSSKNDMQYSMPI